MTKLAGMVFLDNRTLIVHSIKIDAYMDEKIALIEHIDSKNVNITVNAKCDISAWPSFKSFKSFKNLTVLEKIIYGIKI